MCLLEFVALLLGFAALLGGQFFLFGTRRVVEGAAARVIGLLLLLPMATGFYLGFTRYREAVEEGIPLSLEDMKAVSAVELTAFVGCTLTVVLLALLFSRRPPVRLVQREDRVSRSYAESAQGRVRLRSEDFLPSRLGQDGRSARAPSGNGSQGTEADIKQPESFPAANARPDE